MSENMDRRTRNFSKYDSMSTEQLQEILRLDAHRNDGVEMDTDELFYIMEVLADRRKTDSAYTGKTVQEAYETFQKHYLPKEEPVSRKPVVMPSWLHKAAAVAAVLAIILTATLTVDANGFNLWGKVAQWSEDFFRFEDETQGTEASDPDKNNQLEFASVQDALDKYGITQRLAPTWLPEGYFLEDIDSIRSPKETRIFAIYKNGDNLIQVSIRRLNETKSEDIEKSENFIEAYEVNGVTYYLFKNLEKIKVAWVVDDFECYISARITIEEMKNIINSI